MLWVVVIELVRGQDFEKTGGLSIDVIRTSLGGRSMSIIDMALEKVKATRTGIGALSNRHENTVNK